MVELTIEILDKWEKESRETIAEGNHDITFDDFRAIVYCFPSGVFIPDSIEFVNTEEFSHIDEIYIDPRKINPLGVIGERTWIINPDEVTIEKNGMIRIWWD